jgi:hypothetical protein
MLFQLMTRSFAKKVLNTARVLATLLAMSVLISACDDKPKPTLRINESPAQRSFVNHPVQVQHILIGFKGSLPGKEIQRTREEAEKLARELFEKAKAAPAKFEDLVRANSDDQVPGIYEMVDSGRAPAAGQFSRSSMVKAFGDEAFRLQVGELGFVSFDTKNAPYGYHVLLRLR